MVGKLLCKGIRVLEKVVVVNYVDANLDSFIGKWQHYTSEVQQFGLNENLIDYSFTGKDK